MNFAKIISSAEIGKDAVLELERFKGSSFTNTYLDDVAIREALEKKDTKFLRELSVYFTGVSGIYSRLLKYMAGILTYDHMVYPYMLSDKFDNKKVNEDTNEVIRYMDLLKLKTSLYTISLQVLTEGAYYGYVVTNKTKTAVSLLDLPVRYCRSRYTVNGMDAVEFNVKYFDDNFRDATEKALVINSFPKEFAKAYNAYKAGTLKADTTDRGVWFLCDVDLSMRFALSNDAIPLLITAIPAIITLEEAKQIDMKKTLQELLKVIVQRMPLDKNGDLIFDIDEAADMHNNAVQMIDNSVNVDVLTTFAEIEMLDLDNTSASSAASDNLTKIERGVFNEAGASQMLFNTDGNLSLEKSILNDEAIMFYLLAQYENKLNAVIGRLFNTRTEIVLSMPSISIYNKERKEALADTRSKAGYSKLMPAIISGQSQSAFLSLNVYENKILKLNDVMKPLSISSTQSSSTNASEKGSGGAPAKAADEVSDKTIQNQESLS